MRLKDVYGVKMTSLEEIGFSKYLSNNNIAMNTKTADERKAIALNWLRQPKSQNWLN